MQRILLLLILSFALASPSWAAVAKIGSQSSCASGNLFAGTTTYTLTYPAALTSGSLAVVSVYVEATINVSSISGTGATYALSGAQTTNATAGFRGSQWYAVTSSAGTTATVTLDSSTSSNSAVCFVEFSGNDSDQSTQTTNASTTNATATAHSSGSVTPAATNNVVVASSWRTPTSAPGWTEDGSFTMVSTADQQHNFGYLIQSSATAKSFSMTPVDAEYSAMNISAFVGTASGGSSNTFFRKRIQ